jgi:hypothetical protein
MHQDCDGSAIIWLNRQIKTDFLHRGAGYDVLVLELLKLCVPTSGTDELGIIVPHILRTRLLHVSLRGV